MWWRLAVLPSLPWVVCFLSLFTLGTGKTGAPHTGTNTAGIKELIRGESMRCPLFIYMGKELRAIQTSRTQSFFTVARSHQHWKKIEQDELVGRREPVENWGSTRGHVHRFQSIVNSKGGKRYPRPSRLQPSRDSTPLLRTRHRCRNGERGVMLEAPCRLPTASNSRRGLSRLRDRPQLRLRANKLPSPNHCDSHDFLLVNKNLSLKFFRDKYIKRGRGGRRTGSPPGRAG